MNAERNIRFTDNLNNKDDFRRKSFWTRRAVLAGTGLGAIAALIHGISPSFWGGIRFK
jgi:hypothetical protein